MAGPVLFCPCVLRPAFLLCLFASLFALLDSRRTKIEGFLGDTYPAPMMAPPQDGFPFASLVGDAHPQQEESALFIVDEAQTHVWPQVILDYMRHQLRFRGRSKKNIKNVNQ